jgi:hypothetical protein
MEWVIFDDQTKKKLFGYSACDSGVGCGHVSCADRCGESGPGGFGVDGRHFGKKDGVQKGRPKRIKLEELSKDEQIEYLKMENAVLKKVKALRKDYGEH